MLIGGDDISNDLYPWRVLPHVFQCLFTSRLISLCTDWRKSDSSVNGGIGGAIQIPET